MKRSSPGEGTWYLLAAMMAAVAVTASSLHNGFAYDDIPMIVDNVRVTTLGAPWGYAGQAYWPGGGLYRPLTVWLLAILWSLGDGTAWPFHLANIVLHLASTVLVYLLARRALVPAWAGLAALGFAVHPVHVEAVANAVGVSELLCTGLVLASVLLALDGVANGFTPWRRLGVVFLGLLAAVSKEQGFVTPVLLLATAAAVGTPGAALSVRRVAPVAGALAMLLLAVLLLRSAVLGGLAGQDPVAPLQGLAPAARALVSLGTVPEWTRLLLWPARLSFDYSPPGYAIAATPAARHLLAALMLGACAWLAWQYRRTGPAVTLGLAWVAIALLPVSNLIVPTGILLAERTLYLASVGAVLAVAAAIALLWPRLRSPVLRPLALAALAALLASAAGRSVTRAAAWRDNDALFARVELEAPDNYRAHRMQALHLKRLGRLDQAEHEYRRSIALWGHDPLAYEELAILLHSQGRDTAAATVLKTGLAVAPAAPVMRSKLYYIQAAGGEWREARATAATGLSLGDTMFAPLLRSADSALTAPSSPSTSPRE